MSVLPDRSVPSRTPVGPRTTWHLGVGLVGSGWLLAALVVGVRGLVVEVDPWLPVHLLLLGAASNAILVWSSYFSDALLRLPAPARRRPEATRLALFNVGALAVVAGMTLDVMHAVVAGAVLAVASVLWHGTVVLVRLRRSLPSRFGATVRYYVAASALLPLGITLGVVMATHDLDDELHARVALAHVALNVLGWMGLTVVGTLVTLWPTMLHTQVADGAERAVRQAFPVLVGSVLVAAALALLGSRLATAVALAVYVGAVVLAGRGLVEEAVRRRPSTYATWSVGLGALWFLGSTSALVVVVATSSSWETAAAAADGLAVPLLVGFAAQTVLGALSYLVPVVLGGGPSTSRATIAVLDTAARTRLVLVNVGVLASVLPVPAHLRTALWAAALVSLASILPLVVVAVRVRHRRTPTASS